MTRSRGVAATPRRRRTHICPHLRIDGGTVTIAQVESWVSLHRLRGIATSITHRALACLARPDTVMSRHYVDDVCTSSWGRACPFLPAKSGDGPKAIA